ncbi:MAG: PAS domain S-box protein [Acidobacteria bacterium]|nr:PAS domain S-box protein [Acidobacteriota bacterium]MBU4306382.1 PAS domain S-box protein [Acidobacteriota bacterium]MCG2810166.1 PAS domain S-box protein [Candidatus Aminicenantes bacterium]
MKTKSLVRQKPAGEAEKLKQLKGRMQKRTRELVSVNRALLESEERYRELVANMPNGVLVHKKGRIVFVNDYILSVIGCTLEEILGKSVLDFVHPDDRDIVGKNMALRLANKQAAQGYDVHVTTRKGEWRTVVIQAKNIVYDNGPAILSVLTDITEKRRSEKIREAVYKISEATQMADNLPELYRSIHQIISGLMCTENFYIALFDQDSAMLSFPYFIDKFDVPPATRGLENGLTEYVLRTGNPLLATPEILSELEKQGEIELIGAPSIDWLGVPLKIRGKNIGVLVVQTYSPGLRYGPDEKNILMFVSNQVAMAIERKRTEANLRHCEQKNQAVLSAMPDLMFLLDKDGFLLDCKAEKDSGLLMKPEMFLGQKITDVLPPWLADMTMDNIRRTLQTRSLQVYEYEININGQLQYDEARCVLCGSDKVLVVIRNMTEKRRLEQQVLQAQKMESLGTLAGGIAHDFNNILAGILGYASFLKSKISVDHVFFKYVDTIERSAVRAADLTSKLLAFTRGDKVNYKPLNINKLIRETLEIIHHTIDKSISVETKLDESLPTIIADAGQIQQVVMNLCVNARDAMSGGGKLSIATATAVIGAADPQASAGTKTGTYLKMSVTDSGSGMDQDVLTRIFDPFFTTKAKGQGSGLGLSVVYGIVKGHEGFVTVSSQPGLGTVFGVYFPVSGKPEAQEAWTVEPLRGRGELIFVVDDEEDIRNFIRDVLQRHGYRVLLAANGCQAVDIYKVRGQDIALVILDMVMPEMGGEETFLKMKKVNPGIKALLSTGYSQDSRVSEILNHGIKGFIQKPYDFSQLLAKLRQILDPGE